MEPYLASIINYLIGLAITTGSLFYLRTQPQEKKILGYSISTCIKWTYAAIAIFIVLIVATVVTGKSV